MMFIKLHQLLIQIYIWTDLLSALKITINYTLAIKLMQQPEPKDNNNKIQLPSIHQFYNLSLLNYTELTLKKIEMHLTVNQKPCESGLQTEKYLQNTKYHKISNQELRRRSNFLMIVYQLMMVYGKFVTQISPKTYEQLSKVNSCIILSVWLQKLRLGNDELSKLTRLKKSIQEDLKVDSLNRRLIAVLLETEIYIFQILIRLMILQLIYSQNEKYNDQIKQLKNKFKFHHLDPQREDRAEMIELDLKPMRKSSQIKCKELFKQINRIITFYQLEVSTNRQDCRIKPELEVLLQLIEDKFRKDLVVEIFRKTELGNLNLQIKQNKKTNIFAPFILVPLSSENVIETPTQKINEEPMDNFMNQKSEKNEIDLKEFESQQFVSVNNEEEPSVELQIQKNEMSQSQSLHLQKQQLNRPITQNHFEKTAESANVIQKQNSNSEKSKSKFEAESALSSYLKQKNKKHKYFTTKLSNYSQYKKLQYISRHQRFSSRCNLQNKLVKSKRQNSESQSAFQEQIRQYNDRVRKQSKAKHNRSLHRDDLQSLANETPKRGLPFYEKKEND